MKFGIPVLTTILITGFASTSFASFAEPSPFETNEELEEDLALPDPPSIALDSIVRGIGPQPCPPPREKECETASPLDKYGTITIELSQTEENVGYILEVVSGTLPAGSPLQPLGEAVNDQNERLWLRWEDGATDGQEAFEFELRVIPVNEAGEQGDPSNTLLISDPGRAASTSDEDQGIETDDEDEASAEMEEDADETAMCSVSSAAPPSFPFFLFVCGLVALYRRRSQKQDASLA